MEKKEEKKNTMMTEDEIRDKIKELETIYPKIMPDYILGAYETLKSVLGEL